MIRFGMTWTPILVAMIILWGYFWTRLSKCHRQRIREKNLISGLYSRFFDFTIFSVWSMDYTWHVRWVLWFTVLSCFKVLVFYALLDWHLICNICKPWKSREVAWLTAFSCNVPHQNIIAIVEVQAWFKIGSNWLKLAQFGWILLNLAQLGSTWFKYGHHSYYWFLTQSWSKIDSKLALFGPTWLILAYFCSFLGNLAQFGLTWFNYGPHSSSWLL